ncbi:MAG: hypothetical protein IJR46_07540 [Neisseriaceae bacterium]|nr:hypothetical protein [Neisseriaceae bacterium]
MKKIFTHIVSLLLASQLSACATQALWNKDATTYTEKYQDIGTDKVYAFAQVKQNKAMFQAGDLVMMGENYWYVINKKTAEEKNLLPILNASFPLAYKVDRVNIILKEKKQQDAQETPFYTKFCLGYDAQNHHEIEKLKALNFQASDKQPEHYQQCLTVHGSLYRSPEQIPADYHFETTIPVYLQTFSLEKHTNPALYIGQLLGSVVTIPFDAAMIGAAIMVAIPIFMVVGEPKK